MSIREQHEHAQQVQRIGLIKSKIRELAIEWHGMSDRYSEQWGKLAELDKTIETIDPELLSQVQHRESRISFLQNELHGGALSTNEDTRMWAEKVLKSHQKYLVQLLKFANDYKGEHWDARQHIWDTIEDLRLRQREIEDELPRLEALLPPAHKTPQMTEEELAEADKAFDEIPWVSPDGELLTPDEVDDMYLRLDLEHHEQWQQELQDIGDEALREELEQTEIQLARILHEQKNYKDTVSDNLLADLEITEAQKVLSEKTDAYKLADTAYTTDRDQYNQKLENLTAELESRNGLVQQAMNELVLLFEQPSTPAYPQFYPNHIQVPWDKLEDDDEREVARKFEEAMTECSPLIQTAFGQIQNMMTDRVTNRDKALEALYQYQVFANENISEKERKRNSAYAEMEEARQDLELKVGARAAELNQAIPIIQHQTEVDAFAYRYAQEKATDNRSKARQLADSVPPPRDENDTRSNARRLADSVNEPKNIQVNIVDGVRATAEIGFDVKATATVISASDRIKELMEENEKLRAEKTERDDATEVLNDNLDWAIQYSTAQLSFRTIPEDELRVTGIPPRQRAVLRMNQMHKDGQLVGEVIPAKLSPRKFEAKRKKAIAMTALRVGVEIKTGTVMVRVEERMDNTGNQLGVMFMVDGKEYAGVAMLVMHKEAEWTLDTAGSVDNELWMWAESNTEGVHYNIKNQYMTKDVSYFLDAHRKIKAHVQKKKAEALSKTRAN